MASQYRSIISFGRAREGAIAPIIGLTIVALLFAAGVAVDSARAYRVASDATAALDAAALATAKALRLQKPSDAELEAIASDFFKANIDSRASTGATFGTLQIEIDRATNAVKLHVVGLLPTTITSLMGVETLDVAINSAAVFDAKNVELSMMLDVSGSMSGQKILDLHAAAKDLVTTILSENTNGARHRIAIAPFATAVNAGTFAPAATGTSFAKCVTERTGANAFNDKPPSSGPFGKKTSTCPVNAIVPLTDSEDVLASRIDALKANGSTAGHLGIAWAWYLVSPEWADFWPEESKPKPYDDPETQKVVIIMTDGEFNTAYESANGNSKIQAQKLCANMKGDGIIVYSVGFQVPPEALPILEYCATSPSTFFDARDGTQLRDTFQTIAKRLAGLRLTS